MFSDDKTLNNSDVNDLYKTILTNVSETATEVLMFIENKLLGAKGFTHLVLVKPIDKNDLRYQKLNFSNFKIQWHLNQPETKCFGNAAIIEICEYFEINLEDHGQVEDEAVEKFILYLNRSVWDFYCKRQYAKITNETTGEIINVCVIHGDEYIK